MRTTKVIPEHKSGCDNLGPRFVWGQTIFYRGFIYKLYGPTLTKQKIKKKKKKILKLKSPNS